jgi:hypothetical protein
VFGSGQCGMSVFGRFSYQRDVCDASDASQNIIMILQQGHNVLF